MTVQIKLKKIPSKISVKATLVGSEAIATLKKDVGASNYDRLDRLKDVDEGLLPQDGSTLVYDQETDKYEVKKLSLDDIDADLDGGSF
ncbi:MAG: hypothetical protein ACK5DE_14725 [Bacteroidota bacterium]|jgi:hypothetical protein